MRRTVGGISLFTLSSGTLGLLLLSRWLTIDWYAGLSCALHALLVLVSAGYWKRDRFLSLATGARRRCMAGPM